VADVNGDGAKTLADELRQASVQADLTRADDIQRMLDLAYQRWGRLDVLFNNAGIAEVRQLLELTEDEWDRTLAVNLRAVFFVLQGAPKRMRHQSPIAGSELRGKLIQTACGTGECWTQFLWEGFMLTTPRAVLLGFSLIAVAIVLQPITLNPFIIAPVHADSQDISFSQLLSAADQGRVSDVLIQGPEIHGTYIDGRSFQTYAPSDPSLIQRLYNKGVQITARPQSDNVPWIVSLLIVAVIGVWMFLSRQMQVALSSIAHAIEQIGALLVPRA
jgi:hypothetical protein